MEQPGVTSRDFARTIVTTLVIVIDRYRPRNGAGGRRWPRRKNGDKNAMHNPSGRDERSARGCDASEEVARRAGEEARP